MEGEDIRWVQRFSNYKKALAKLSDAVRSAKEKALSELETEGLIQRFEYTYELAWKTLQDLLRFKGYINISGPNVVLTQAFSDGYIVDSTGWSALKNQENLRLIRIIRKQPTKFLRQLVNFTGTCSKNSKSGLNRNVTVVRPLSFNL